MPVSSSNTPPPPPPSPRLALALKIFKEVGAPEIKDVSASVDKTMALFDKDKNGKLDLKEFQMFMVVMTVFMMRGGDKEGE